MSKSWQDIVKERSQPSNKTTKTRSWGDIVKERGGSYEPIKIEKPKEQLKPKVIKPKVLNVDTSRPSVLSGGRPMINFDQKKLDKASSTAGAFVSNALDSATLGLATKGLDKFENGLGTKSLEDASKGHKIASTVGNLAGYMLPFAGASKVVKPLAKNLKLAKKLVGPLTKTQSLANKALPLIVSGAGEGALIGGTEAKIKGNDVLKSAGEMAALGVGGNLATAGLSKLASKLLKPRVIKPEPKVIKIQGNPKTIKQRSAEIKTNEYYNNIDAQDFANSSDPAYIQAENKLRASKGLKPLTPEQIIGKFKQNQLNPSKSVEQPNIFRDTNTKTSTQTIPESSMRVNMSGASVSDNVNSELGFSKLQSPIQPSIEQPILSSNLKEGQKVSKFYSNSLMEGNTLTKEGKKALDETQYIYDVKHNEDSLKRAQDLLNTNGLDKEVNRLKTTGLNSAEDSMTHYLATKELMNEAKITGDYTKLNSFLETTRPSITNAGQTIQALSQFKKSTPEGAVMTAHKVVENVKNAIKKENPNAFKKATDEINKLPKDANFEVNKNAILKKNGIPSLTNDEIKEIVDRMTNAQGLEGRAKDIEIAKVMQLIGDKVPASIAEKVKALQRISLLLNTKTMGRNIFGNVILGGLENAKDVVGAPLDYAVSKITKQRTTGLPNIFTQAKGFAQGTKEIAQDIKYGIDTSASRGQYEIPQGRIFQNKILNKLDKATKYGLQLGDRPFYQSAYNDRLNQLMKFNNVTEPTEDIIKQATEFAKERTFQNDSNIAKGFKRFQEGLNEITGNKDIGIGNFAMPFVKTPANILDKIVDYSPAGFARALNELKNVNKGTFNQKTFIDKISRGVTGTGLIMLGYDLASKGHLMGGTNRDKDVAALQKQTGASPYSIKVGDSYFTIDWAQPSAVPLMIGADIFHGGKDRKGAQNVVVDAVKSGGETLFKQSLLQGVQKLFGGYTPLQGIEDVALSIPGQFVPSVLKQGAQALDKTQRETYSPTLTGKATNIIQSKLPIVSKNMQPKIDTLGREVENYQGNNTALNILINPGTKTTNKETAGEKLVLDIYNKTGLKTQFPRVAPKSIKGTPLTPEMFVNLQKEMGSRTNELLENLAKSESFKNRNPENQAKYIENKLSDIFSISKRKVLPKELLFKK